MMEHAFYSSKTKLKEEMPQEQNPVAVEAWQNITRNKTQHLVIFMPVRLQVEIDCKELKS